MKLAHEKMMILYNSAFEKHKHKHDPNVRRKNKLFYEPKHSLLTKESEEKISSKIQEQSNNLYKNLGSFHISYEPMKSYQDMLLQNHQSKYNAYQPMKTKRLKSTEMFVVPILMSSSRLPPKQHKIKQSNKLALKKMNQRSCSTFQRAKTAKNKNQDNHTVNLKTRTQKKIIGIQYHLRKRDSIISNSSLKGGLTDTTQCPSIIYKKIDKNNFDNLLAQISKKNGYYQNTKLFIVEVQDKAVKKGLMDVQGWAENPNPRSLYFNIKWVQPQNPSIYKQINPKQYINHFRNIDKLINPVQRHQYFNSDRVLKFNYPESYNLEQSKQQFLYQYEIISIMSLLNSHIKYIQSKNIPLLTFSQHKKLQSQHILSSLLKSKNFYSQINYQNFLINIPIVLHMCIYLQNLKLSIEDNVCPLSLSQYNIKKLVQFSQITAPYHVLGNQKQLDQYPIIFSQDYNLFKTKNSFRSPSKSLINLIQTYYDYFKNTKFFNNLQNIWVINSSKQSPMITKNRDIIIMKRQQCIIHRYIKCSKVLECFDQFKGKSFVINYFLLVIKSKTTRYLISKDYYISTLKEQQKIFNSSFEQLKTQYMDSGQFESLLMTQSKINYRGDIQIRIKNFLHRYLSKFQFQHENNKFQILNVKIMLDQKYHFRLYNIQRMEKLQNNISWIQDIHQNLISDTVKIIFKEDNNTDWVLLLQNKKITAGII